MLRRRGHRPGLHRGVRAAHPDGSPARGGEDSQRRACRPVIVAASSAPTTEAARAVRDALASTRAPGRRGGHEGQAGASGRAEGGQGQDVVLAHARGEDDEQSTVVRQGMGAAQDVGESFVDPQVDPGQGVEHRLDIVVVPDAGVDGGIGGQEVHGIPLLVDVGRNGSGHGHRPLEPGRRPRGSGRPVRGAAGVEQNHGTPACGAVLLTHHHRARACRGRPVDPPEVITLSVFTNRLVVLAVEGDLVRNRPVGTHATSQCSFGHERMDARSDEHCAGAVTGPWRRREPEGVAEPHAQWPQLVDASDVRSEGVLHLAHVARRCRWDDEARPIAERGVEFLLGEREGRGTAARVDQTGDDHGRLVDREPCRVRRTRHREARGTKPPHEKRADEQGQEQRADPRQVRLPEEQASDEQDAARCEEGRPPLGEHRTQGAHHKPIRMPWLNAGRPAPACGGPGRRARPRVSVGPDGPRR
ncbi:MAG TPA: hypothetical protein PLA46_02080 [Phycicoccus sp.]|nr:hypothetical protein [Phycicoccus sp.]